jgi:hypothetical protein
MNKGNSKLKKDQLKPYVYKVEGAVNFAFYDMLNGAFYQVEPKGNIEELRKTLLKEGLIFETNGIVPNKIILKDISEIQKKIRIRTLQIRLYGSAEDNCWNRIKSNTVKKEMSDEILEKIISNCKYIPIKKIQVESEEDDVEKIDKIIKYFKFKELQLYVKIGINKKRKEHYREICAENNINFLKNEIKKISEFKVDTISLR